MEIQIKGEAVPQAPQPPQRSKGSSLFWGVLNVILVLSLAACAIWMIGSDRGWFDTIYTRALLTPQPAATSAPVATRAPAVQQQQQVVPTAPAAIQADPAPPLPAPAIAQPAETVDDAPAELEGAGTSFSRGTICFDEWYYVDGIRSNTRCVGGGGD